MSLSPGLVAWRLAFQICPVILTGGVASAIPGGMLPMLSFSEALNFTAGLLSGGRDVGLDDFFANFDPMAGATLIDNAIGKYPFANQAVAANAIIANPLQVSLKMTCPVRDEGGYAIKLATMMGMQATFKQHNSQGGTYTIATPSFFYTDCIMTRMTDVSAAISKQPQTVWQLDFEKPLLSIEDAEAAQNSLMAKITNGTPFSSFPTATGLDQAVGSPQSLAAPSGVIPAAIPAAGANASMPDSTIRGPR